MCTFGNFWNAVTIIWKSCLVRYLTERPKKGLVLGHVGWWSLVFATLVILRLSWAASSYAHVIIMPLVLPTVVFAPRMEKQTSEVVTFTINMHFTHHLTIFWRCHISFTHSVIATVQTWRNRNPFFLWPSDNCQWLAIASVTCQSYAHINAQPKHPAATFLCSSRLCMWHQNGQNKLRRMARSWPQGSGCMSALCASGPVTAGHMQASCPLSGYRRKSDWKAWSWVAWPKCPFSGPVCHFRMLSFSFFSIPVRMSLPPADWSGVRSNTID